MTRADKPELATGIRIVLVDTSHPGNIGASARAMKTMGLEHLVLVRPQGFPAAEATARATGADDVLAAARTCDSLQDALSPCGWVIATSARARRLEWPQLTPRQAARRAVQEAARAPVAIVFGGERSGLKNEELDLCQALVRIPTAAGFGSLNLAAAVQVLSYELHVAFSAIGPRPGCATSGDGERHREEEAVSHAEMEGFYRHLDQVLIEIGYLDPTAPKLLRRRLRRLFNRARPEGSELNILRGILSAIQSRGRARPRA